MSEDQSKNEPDSMPDNLGPRWIESDDGVYEGYANFFHLNWTPLDVRIRFAQIVPDQEHQKVGASPGWMAEEHAALTMGWGHAKILRDLLTDVIRRYENLNGELTIPKMPA